MSENRLYAVCIGSNYEKTDSYWFGDKFGKIWADWTAHTPNSIYINWSSFQKWVVIMEVWRNLSYKVSFPPFKEDEWINRCEAFFKPVIQ